VELRQLRYFKAIAEELHFQRAARKVHISQPTLSQQLKLLEEELDVTLVDRDRQSVQLTKAGTAFLASVSKVLADLENAKKEVQNIAGLEFQHLRIGTIDYINLDIVAKSIVEINLSNPNIDIEQVEMPTDEVYNALKEGEIDVAIGPLPVSHPSLVVKKIMTGTWSLVVSDDGELAQHDQIALSQLKNEPLIFFDKSLNPKMHRWWMETFEDNGVVPQIVFETKQVQTALKMVKDKMASYVVASYIVNDLPIGLKRIPLSGFDNQMAVGVVWHESNKSKTLKSYLDVLRKLTA